MICSTGFFTTNLIPKSSKNEGEGYGSGFVGPESWGVFNRLIYTLLHAIFKFVMCNYCSLWKTIPALSDINVYFSAVCNFSEGIFINNLLEYDVKGHLHIYVTVHWCVEIKFPYLHTQIWRQVLIW